MTAIRRRGSPPPHGTRRRYAYWGCRCPDCREAERLYEKRHRENRAPSEFVHPAGTARRIQALIADGRTYQVIADHLRCNPSWVSQLARADLTPRPRGILRRTADQVTTLYNQLTAVAAPQGRSATYARTVAAKYGWLPPSAWEGLDIDDPTDPDAPDPDYVDEVALEQVLAGNIRFTALHDADRTALVARLTGQGLTVGQICYRLHVSESSVVGYLPETHPEARNKTQWRAA